MSTETTETVTVPAPGAARAARRLPAALDGVHDLVDPALRAALTSLCPQMLRVSGYHLGWWDADGVAERGGAGKAVRPSLALLSARAVSAPVEAGVPAAVAVELVHNFSLLHDDIMDGDVERRHRATAWRVFGNSAAILSGDALLTAAVEVLLDVETPAAARAAKVLTVATQRLISGQTADLDFEHRTDVTLEESVAMASDKTAALLNAACAIGAVLADGPAETSRALGAFGEELGIAFQLVDDLLGIWGAPAATGKAVLADLRARKKSLPVVAALRAPGAAAEELASLYLKPDALSEEQLLRVARLIEETGAREWAESEADRRYRLALDHLAGLRMPEDVHADFVELARFIVDRDR